MRSQLDLAGQESGSTLADFGSTAAACSMLSMLISGEKVNDR
ncbi:hypothetical protein [Variovorax sp. YR752]